MHPAAETLVLARARAPVCFKAGGRKEQAQTQAVSGHVPGTRRRSLPENSLPHRSLNLLFPYSPADGSEDEAVELFALEDDRLKKIFARTEQIPEVLVTHVNGVIQAVNQLGLSRPVGELADSIAEVSAWNTVETRGATVWIFSGAIQAEASRTRKQHIPQLMPRVGALTPDFHNDSVSDSARSQYQRCFPCTSTSLSPFTGAVKLRFSWYGSRIAPTGFVSIDQWPPATEHLTSSCAAAPPCPSDAFLKGLGCVQNIRRRLR